MSGPEAERVYREAPPFEELNAKRLVPLILERIKGEPTSRRWFRLCADAHADTFYPGKNSRLTPASGKFPCAYFAEDETTCFCEVFGERIARHAATKPGVPFVIAPADAKMTGLYELVDAPDLKLCDLTIGDTLPALGLDLGTLYAPDIGFARRWAEAIARMDVNFDGIRYRSRHTGKECQVIWDRPGEPPASANFRLARVTSLFEAPFAWQAATALGTRISFPDDPAAT